MQKLHISELPKVSYYLVDCSPVIQLDLFEVVHAMRSQR